MDWRKGATGMDGTQRKAAIDAYKERKVPAGIYAVRCAATGQCWLGKAPDLTTIQNRIWFVLRHGSSTCRSLQAAWRDHGADAFMFEVIEQLEDEEDAYLRGRLLKSRLEHWLAELQASPI
jgi:hypothetical protein